MAKATAPLFCLSAHGDIAETLQYNRSKGRNIVRKKPEMPYVTSPGLVVARAHHAAAINAYRTIFTLPDTRTAWQRHATYKREKLSRYDEAVKHTILAYRDGPTPGMGTIAKMYSDSTPEFYVQDVATGAPSGEAGEFQIYVGATPETMRLFCSAALVDGYCWSLDPIPAMFPAYLQLAHGSTMRSGIHKYPDTPDWWLTLEAAGCTDAPTNGTYTYQGHYNWNPYYLNATGTRCIWAIGTTPSRTCYLSKALGSYGDPEWWWMLMDAGDYNGDYCWLDTGEDTFTVTGIA